MEPVVHRRTRRKLTALVAFILVLIFGLNAVAFFQAHSMTTFVPTGKPGGKIEELSWLQRAKLILQGARMERPLNDFTPDQYGMRFSTDTITSRDGVQLELWTIPQPDARGVVCLFHGYRASKEALIEESRSLNDLGFTTVLVDFRGSGGSSGNTTTIGYDEAMDVAAVIKFAKTKFPSGCLIIYGQSMGAAAILRAVAKDSVTADALIIESVFDRLITTVGHRFEAMKLPITPLAQLLVFWGGIQHGFNGFRHDPEEYASHVAIPTLVLHGEEDHRATITEAHHVFEGLKGRKEFLGFPGVTHRSCHDANPMLWIETVGKFTTEVCKSGK